MHEMQPKNLQVEYVKKLSPSAFGENFLSWIEFTALRM